MEIKGKIIKVLDIQSGVGKSGKTWMKQEFILETGGQYPKKVCISLWGEEKINEYDLEEGLTVTAHLELESREYNGRWYTEVRSWKIQWDAQARREWKPGGQPGAAMPEPKAGSRDGSVASDDLPF